MTGSSNAEWIDSLNWGEIDDPGMWLTRIVVLSVIGGAAFDIVQTGLRAEQARRGLATPVAGTEQVV